MLCELAVKSELLGIDIICPKCLISGRLFFISTWVARGIIWYGKDGRRIYQEIKVPLARCRECGGRFRVLSEDILPYKLFSLPVIEDLCRTYVQPDPYGPGLRKVVEGPVEVSPNYSTLHRWTEGLGERVLDRLRVTSDVSNNPDQKSLSFPEPWLPAAALISESAKRINPGVRDQWRQSFEIPSWKYHSSRRHDQLQACARLFDVADFLFPNEPHPLTAWQAQIIEYLHVAGWWFPTGYNCTAIQLSPGGSYQIKCSATSKTRKKEVNHGSRSPPDGLVSV